MNIGELIKDLQEYPPETVCACHVWLPGDVTDQAEAMGLTLTEEQNTKVLELVEHSKDATIGISWDTLESAIHIILGK